MPLAEAHRRAPRPTDGRRGPALIVPAQHWLRRRCSRSRRAAKRPRAAAESPRHDDAAARPRRGGGGARQVAIRAFTTCAAGQLLRTSEAIVIGPSTARGCTAVASSANASRACTQRIHPRRHHRSAWSRRGEPCRVARVLLVDHDVDALAETRRRAARARIRSHSRTARRWRSSVRRPARTTWSSPRATWPSRKTEIYGRDGHALRRARRSLTSSCSSEQPENDRTETTRASCVATSSASWSASVAREPDGGVRRPRFASLNPSALPLENGRSRTSFSSCPETRSGTLTVTTPKGSGGSASSTATSRTRCTCALEGLKAVTRMISGARGTATFVPGAPAIMRRITNAHADAHRGERSRGAYAAAQGQAGTSPHTLIAADGGVGEDADASRSA